MGTADLVGRCLGEPEVPNLSKGYQVGHGTECLFNGDVRIDAVQDIDIHCVGSQSPQTRIDCSVYVSRRPISTDNMTVCVADKSELRCQHHLVPALLDSPSHEFFILPCTVTVSRVQKIASQIERTMYRGRRFGWICRSIRIRQSKTAKPYWTDLWSIRT